MGRAFAIQQGNVTGLQNKLDKIKLTMMGGGLLAGSGLLGLHMLKPAVAEAERFQTQVANFRTFGLPEKLNQDAARFAKNMSVAGSSYVTNMRLINEAQGVFRESGRTGPGALEGAKIAAPVLARIRFANLSLDPEARGRQDSQALSMLRFIEMRGGVNDPRRFNAIADAGFKAIRSSGGAVNWEQLRQFSARSGIAGQGLSNEALFGKLEPAIVELKGSTAGTALMTAYNRLNGLTKVPNQVKDTLLSTGIWDRSKVTTNSLGGVKTISGNPMRDAATFASDPVLWYERNVVPIYQKQGLTMAEKARQNALFFGRTGGTLFTLIDRQLPAIHNSVEAQRKALGINDAYRVAGASLAGKRVIAGAAWANVKEAAGEALLPIIATGLTAMVGPLKALAGLFKTVPWLMKPLVIAFAGLSVLAVVAGGVLLFAGAIAVVGLAVTALSAGGALAGVGVFFAGIGTTIMGFLAPIGVAVGGLLLPILPVVAGVVALGAAVYFIGKALGLDWGALGKKVWGFFSDIWYRLNHFGQSKPVVTPAVLDKSGRVIRPATTSRAPDSLDRMRASVHRQDVAIAAWMNKNLPSYVSLGAKVDKLANGIGSLIGKLGTVFAGGFVKANAAVERFGAAGDAKLKGAYDAANAWLGKIDREWTPKIVSAITTIGKGVGGAALGVINFVFKMVDGLVTGATKVVSSGQTFNTGILTFVSSFVRTMQQSADQVRRANVTAGLAPASSAPPVRRSVAPRMQLPASPTSPHRSWFDHLFGRNKSPAPLTGTAGRSMVRGGATNDPLVSPVARPVTAITHANDNRRTTLINRTSIDRTMIGGARTVTNTVDRSRRASKVLSRTSHLSVTNHHRAVTAPAARPLVLAAPPRPPERTLRAYTPPAQGKATVVHTYVHLDGRQVAKSVTRHQDRDLHRAPVGGAAYDPTMGPTPVAAGWMGS